MRDAADEVLTVDHLADETLDFADGLDRPLRYIQINSVPNGSTGGIMMKLHRDLLSKGIDSGVAWGRGRAGENACELNFGSRASLYFDVLRTRLDDRVGFHSTVSTKRLLRFLDERNPDVVHLHNLHGYYVNVEMLFGWLARRRCQVRWTLHDCWAFTGHCPHFQYVGCAKWRTGCSDCPQKKGYPSSLLLDSSSRNWEDKRRVFTSVPPERMTLITPSCWLADLVEESFLGGYPVEVRRNTVDKTVFKPTPSDFRERHGVGDRFMILGVASPWTERKGLSDFVRLACELDSGKYVVVLVGLSKRQVASLGNCLVALPKTESVQELASIYSAADVFVHPGVEETFGMTVAEAISCGTKAIVREGSACEEAARGACITISDRGFDPLYSAVVGLAGGDCDSSL